MFLEVVGAEYIEDYKIRITLNSGQCGIIDFKDELWGPVFEPLRNIELFRKYQISKAFGTIEWENGADIAPEFIEEKLKREDARTYCS
ncbi:MAG: DUF2442 domain-containing protein [Spirochaetota bacterium]